MKKYFSKIGKYTLLGMFLVISLSSAGGYFLPSSKTGPKENAATGVATRFNDVRMRFDSGEYRSIMDAVARMGSPDELDKSTALYAAGEFESIGWEAAMDRLYGAEELRLFVNQESEGVGSEDGAVASEQVMFPEITLAGATFSNGGAKAVTVLNINGVPEIWMWEKKNGKWATDSITPGYGLQSAEITRDKILFSLYAVQNMKAVREYDMPTSPDAELAQYKGK